jgi:hypothetical protein
MMILGKFLVELCYAVRFKLTVTYAEYHILTLYAECSYAECCGTPITCYNSRV